MQGWDIRWLIKSAPFDIKLNIYLTRVAKREVHILFIYLFTLQLVFLQFSPITKTITIDYIMLWIVSDMDHLKYDLYIYVVPRVVRKKFK